MMSRSVRTVTVLAALLLASGCLVETTVDANGGGTLKLTYRLTNEAQLAAAKKQLESPDVTLVNASIDKEKLATFEVKFADITKLSTARFFRNAAVTMKDNGDGTKTIETKWTNKNPSKLPDEMLAYFGKDFILIFTAPGDIVKSDATTTKGATATWTMPLNDFTSAKEMTFSATFKAPAAKAGAAKDAPKAP